MPLDAEVHSHLAVFTTSGRAKLTPVDQHPVQRRAGKGLRMIISRSSQPHRCVALKGCHLQDVFDLVDTTGQEHRLDAAKIPVTRRDGNAWTVVNLKGGGQLALVDHRPRVAPDEKAEEGAEAPKDGGAEAEVKA